MHKKVAISGSRTWTDPVLVERVIDRLIENGAHILIPCSGHGDCTAGVDSFVHQYVEHRADDVYDYEVYYAEWDRYKKRAGFFRNELMIHDADELIAILGDGPSPGTHHAILMAARKGIPIHVFDSGTWVTSLPSDAGA